MYSYSSDCWIVFLQKRHFFEDFFNILHLKSSNFIFKNWKKKCEKKLSKDWFLYSVFLFLFLFVYDCVICREKEQYCYENTTTGEIKWEYPEIEQPPDVQENNVLDDDEMDISTTPPPNADEELPTAFYQSNGTFWIFIFLLWSHFPESFIFILIFLQILFLWNCRSQWTSTSSAKMVEWIIWSG